jgi:hypothetical protein
MLVLALLVGIGLRVGVAWTSADHAAEWEADGFVRAWEELPFGGLNQMRPPLSGWVFHQISELAALESILAVRLAGVGLSVISLVCAMMLTLALSGLTKAVRRSRGFALAWLTVVWAVLPTLFFSAPRPTGETLLGGVICLLCAALVVWGRRGGLLCWASLAAMTCVALLAGGVLLAAALGVGLLVYLVPVPRIGVALPVLLAFALGGIGAAWVAGHRPGAERHFVPIDAAPAFAMAELTSTPIVLDARQPVDAALRTRAAYASAWTGARSAGPLGVASAASRRLVLDQLSPRRFDSLGSPMLPVGLLDVFLRGGLLLFAVATLSLTRRGSESSWPRGGVVVALLLLIFVGIMTASSPFAWAPVDLVLLAVAAAGVAGADPDRPAIRWLAFSIGGVMLGALGLGAGLASLSLSPWSTQLTHRAQQGRQLVERLEHGGPVDADGHLTAAYLLMDHAAPFLRFPEAADRHVLAALELDPSSGLVLSALVKSEVENLRLDEAERLVETMLDSSGELSSEGRLLTAWVHDVRSRLLAASGR